MGKQKRMVLFITIEVYYLILPNKSQTDCNFNCNFNTQKIQDSFSNFEV